MSQAEVDRFVEDLKGSEDLQAALMENAGSIDAVTAFASSKGYEISADEARSYIETKSGKELNDEELDSVAGGKTESNVTITFGDIVI